MPDAPDGPPPGRRNRRVAVVIAVVVAIAAAAGGYFFLTGDSGGPDTPAAKDYNAGVEAVGAAEVAWRVAQGEAPEAIQANDYWLTDKNFVRRLPGRVVAYDLKTGKEAWTFPLEGAAEDRCRSSQEQSKNRVALLRDIDDDESKAACGKLTVLDIGTGKEVFTIDLPPGPADRMPDAGDVPVVVGETVVMGSVEGRMFDLNTGAAVPVPAAFAACGARGVGLVGGLLLADSSCTVDDGDDNRRNDESVVRLRAFDANFALVWEWENPAEDEEGKGLPVLGVVSADPLVVEAGYLGHPTQLMSVDTKTGKTVPISDYDATIRGTHMNACDGYSLGNCDHARVADNKVILMTTPEQINPGDANASPGMANTEFRNELVAYDLDTGEEAWRTGQVDGRILGLVRSADDTVVAYQPANPNGTKGIVFAVDPATAKLKPLLPIGPNAHEDDDLTAHIREFNFGGDNHQAVWRDGLFIIFSNTHRDSTQGDLDTVAFALGK